jgi:gluconate 2-dehydrogenase gamma chain
MIERGQCQFYFSILHNINRRSFLKLSGAAAATAAAGCSKEPNQATAPASKAGYSFLNSDEAAFIEAVVARLIPSDDAGPGAREADVAGFIDKQLAGAWGSGERLYRSGPWQAGKPTQGYQLQYTPAELMRHGIAAVAKELASRNSSPFAKLSEADQDAYLKSLEAGQVTLEGMPSKVFFTSLLELTIEGYFSDPIYGGNKEMVAWKMIGFPGAYATYYDLVDQHGIAYTRAPMSIADGGANGSMSMEPQHGHTT